VDRTDGRDYVRSALFLDFDNIYSSLARRDAKAAEVFARKPERWLEWFEQGLGPVGPRSSNDTERVVLQRSCYLNPQVYGRFREGFTRAGFRVVDCPALTRQGKNSADIHMVLDALDVLAHPTYYDEVILLSLDADFTPLFLRLRAHDRRVIMLGTGFAAAPMTRACDYVIPDDVFTGEALGQVLTIEPAPAPEPVAAAPAVAPVAAVTPGPSSTAPATTLPSPAPAEAQAGVPEVDPVFEAAVQTRLREIVAASRVPLAGSAVGIALRTEFGQRLIDSHWAGRGSLRAFVAATPDERIGWCTWGAGYVHDRARHVVPVEDGQAWGEPPGAATPAAVELCTSIVDLPRLRSTHWGVVLTSLAAALTSTDMTVAGSIRVATLTAAARCRAPAAVVSAVIEALRLTGYPVDALEHRPDAVADALASAVVNQVQAAQEGLSDADVLTVRTWFSGRFLTAPPATTPGMTPGSEGATPTTRPVLEEGLATVGGGAPVAP
jgi:hypothetical protein